MKREVCAKRIVKSKQRNIYIYIYSIYAVFAAFYLWLAMQIPYTHDDWDWGIENGIDQLLHATLNSRYAGNLFVVIMTRSELIKVAIMGITYFLIPFILSRIAVSEFFINTPNSSVLLFLFCNTFLLSINYEVWAQTCAWVSGFANFCVSGLFLMLWIFELLRRFDDSSGIFQRDSLVFAFLYFVIAFCGQLFLENIAIYCFLAAIFLCISYYKQYKKIPRRVVFMSVGCVIGLAVMFSSSIYGSLFSTGSAVDGYRNVPLFSGSVWNSLYQIISGTIRITIRLYALNPILSIAILLILTHKIRRENAYGMRFYSKANIVLSAAIVGLSIYDYFSNYSFHNYATVMILVNFGVYICYFLAVLRQVHMLYNGNKKRKLYILWLSAPIVIAPLAFTSEVGRRLYFTTNLFVVLFAVMLFADTLQTLSSRKTKLLHKICAGFAAIAMIFYVFVFSAIGHCKRERDEIIRAAVEQGAEEIILPSYPFAYYLESSEPTNNLRVEYFKLFYGIPLETEITFEER